MFPVFGLIVRSHQSFWRWARAILSRCRRGAVIVSGACWGRSFLCTACPGGDSHSLRWCATARRSSGSYGCFRASQGSAAGAAQPKRLCRGIAIARQPFGAALPLRTAEQHTQLQLSALFLEERGLLWGGQWSRLNGDLAVGL